MSYWKEAFFDQPCLIMAPEAIQQTMRTSHPAFAATKTCWNLINFEIRDPFNCFELVTMQGAKHDFIMNSPHGGSCFPYLKPYPSCWLRAREPLPQLYITMTLKRSHILKHLYFCYFCLNEKDSQRGRNESAALSKNFTDTLFNISTVYLYK